VEVLIILYHIPFLSYLSFLFLYSGWIVLWFRKKMSYKMSFITIMLTQLFYSILLIDKQMGINDIKSNVIVGIALGIVAGLLIYSLEAFIGKTVYKNKEKYRVKERKNIQNWFAISVLIAPFIEEIYFRTAMFCWVSKLSANHMNKDLIFVILSSVMFLLHHPQTFKNKLLIFDKLVIEGIGLSILYLVAKNIYLNMFAHFTFNFLLLNLSYRIKRRELNIGN